MHKNKPWWFYSTMTLIPRQVKFICIVLFTVASKQLYKKNHDVNVNNISTPRVFEVPHSKDFQCAAVYEFGIICIFFALISHIQATLPLLAVLLALSLSGVQRTLKSPGVLMLRFVQNNPTVFQTPNGCLNWSVLPSPPLPPALSPPPTPLDSSTPPSSASPSPHPLLASPYLGRVLGSAGWGRG